MQNRWVRNLAAGLLIGVGCILPGVSGGVMAVSFGLYRPMLDAVMGFFKAPGKHLRFLLPLGAGISGGMALGAAGLSAAFLRWEGLMLMLFTGFITGSIPQLLAEAQKGGRFHARWLWALMAGIALALPMVLFAKEGAQAESLSPMQAFATGLLEGVGTVVPGISTSFVLIRLGWYQAYLRALSGMMVHQAALIGLGFAMSALLCMQAVKWLFDHHPGYAYYGVLGFLMVSAASVFPGFSVRFWAEAGMLSAGVVCALALSGRES